MEVKAYSDVEFKAVDDKKGIYDAIVSVFGNIDSYGDRVVKGAFRRSLEEWAAKGDPIPVVYSHGWSEPPIGKTLDVQETDEGLVTHNQLYLDSPRASEVYRALKDRVITNHSFAYDVTESADVTTQEGTIRELKAVDLIEHGPCLRGVNTETQTLDVKSWQIGILITEQFKAVFDRLDALTSSMTTSGGNVSVDEPDAGASLSDEAGAEKDEMSVSDSSSPAKGLSDTAAQEVRRLADLREFELVALEE